MGVWCKWDCYCKEKLCGFQQVLKVRMSFLDKMDYSRAVLLLFMSYFTVWVTREVFFLGLLLDGVWFIAYRHNTSYTTPKTHFMSNEGDDLLKISCQTISYNLNASLTLDTSFPMESIAMRYERKNYCYNSRAIHFAFAGMGGWMEKQTKRRTNEWMTEQTNERLNNEWIYLFLSLFLYLQKEDVS